jgi:acyl carrier protein
MKEKFLEVIKEALDVESVEIDLSDKLADFDAWDSMARLSLIALLDEHFEVEVTDAEFDNTETVQALFELVKTRMA